MSHQAFFELHVASLRVRGRQGYGRCPFHEDRRASFSVDLVTGLWTCHAGCGSGNARQFADRLGLAMPDGDHEFSDCEILATYDYCDEHGKLLFQVVRFAPKEFRQRRPDGGGGWIWNLDGVRRVPYRLRETLAAIARGDPVFIVEGEKDADRLASVGVAATTNPGGAGKWRDEYAQHFTGARVVVVPDNDQPGDTHAQQVARSLHGVATEARILKLPGLPEGGDISVWLNAGHSLETLGALTDAAPVWSGGEAPHCTDLGNAQRLAAAHGHDLRYDHGRRSWRYWDGTRWILDRTGEVVRRAKQTIAALYAEAATLPDEQARRTLAAWAMSSESAHRIEAMLSLAESEPPIAGAHAFDADPWLLNCTNGTVDLRTGILRPHRREDLITKLAPVAYDPAARHALWDQTLAWALPDEAVRACFQRAVGYSLTADTREDRLFMIIGPTAALKSTVVEAIKAPLGEYAVTADFETFLRRRGVGGPRNDIARLAGARFVLSIEVEQGRRLAEGLIKHLTGGDVVSARFLYAESFEFRPTGKLWLVANHAPSVADDDDALWRRVLRIPFDHTLPEADRDPTVKLRLRDPQTAGAAVLAWAVEGCLAWQRHGLQVPDAIAQATEAYRTEMHPLADFFRDCCTFGPAAWTKAADLRETYESWCRENGERHPLSGKPFTARLRAVGCTPKKDAGARGWAGLSLTPPPEGGNGGVDSKDSKDTNFDNFSLIRAREKVTDSAVRAVLPSSNLPEDAPPILRRAVEIFDGTVLEYRRVPGDA